MVYFDQTKSGSFRHHSGLARVNGRLRHGWTESEATSVVWQQWNRDSVQPSDWFFTSELFSSSERPGWAEWLAKPSCRRAAIFHDAIPLKFPHITWPQSVGRHAGYMKELASFDRIFAVSEASRNELLAFWQWQGVRSRAQVEVIALGANGVMPARPMRRVDSPRPMVLMVGILEPRKNQSFVLDRLERLWSEGLDATLHLVGRVNPHFGKPIVSRIRDLRRRWPGKIEFHQKANDAALSKLYARARVTVFPTLAEGCGLPLLESLWAGVPCVCNDLPVLKENTEGGGCLRIPIEDTAGWEQALGRVLTDDAHWNELTQEACTRTLPTWQQTVATLRLSLT